MAKKIIGIKKWSLLVVFLIAYSNIYSQSQEDIVDYLKNRIELYSQRPTTLEVNNCKLKIQLEMSIPGSPSYITELNCSLKNLTDVMYVNERQPWITLKFKNKDVSYTDIEQNGTKKLWKYDDDISLFFSKGTINENETKKLAELFKKLGKNCGAKILDF
ncbi:hypothetical protein [Winogradskyella poriferorum]|uniref:Uncharacterized protein n=1 Tax=Winogradskyella poriferorum TaxID=307627 RepID=A0ABU7W503_9FLAO